MIKGRQLYTATMKPSTDNMHHGFGYSRFEHQVNGLSLNLLQYVPLADSIKISRNTAITLAEQRRLSVTAFTEWVLGTKPRNASGAFITSARPRN
jgi:cyclic beta-1,2-glucan synthetase